VCEDPWNHDNDKIEELHILGENLSLEGVDEICYLRDMNDRS
jgi:hypothetical protein